MEVNGKASCLCDLGFYGELCEFIAFEGSGVALAFSGVAEAKAEYPLSVSDCHDHSCQPQQ
jgi:hypothetical protein